MNLEKRLKRAVIDPSARRAFLKALLDEAVFIIVEQSEDGSLKIGHCTKEDGTGVIPFFTSFDKLKTFTGNDMDYQQIQCLELFGMITNYPAVINPGSPYCKEFTPLELQALATGNIEAII